VSNLQGNITSQYLLQYVPDVDPSASAKAFRKIKVEITSLMTSSTRIYARDGYYPNPVPPGPAGVPLKTAK
jgi:hypothetical protein